MNPRAAAIAELVLWIGYLQWHIKARGKETISEPIIRKFDNIENRDAVLAWDSIEPVFDGDRNPVTRWDGITTKRHPVTGEDVPDEASQVHELRYINPRKAEWPKAEFIVGNPPFIGQQRMRQTLGDGYVLALRSAHHDLPETCDFVLYWWKEAAERVRAGVVHFSGLVTTNSITQTLNRQVVEAAISAKPELQLRFAVPDHPWEEIVDDHGNADLSRTADVRVAMTTVSSDGQKAGVLLIHQTDRRFQKSAVNANEFVAFKGKINSDLTIGTSAHTALSLSANRGLAIKGFELGSQGFLVQRMSPIISGVQWVFMHFINNSLRIS